MNRLDPPAIAAFCFAACGLMALAAQQSAWLGDDAMMHDFPAIGSTAMAFIGLLPQSQVWSGY